MKNLTKVKLQKNGLEIGAMLVTAAAGKEYMDCCDVFDNDIIKLGFITAVGVAQFVGGCAAMSFIEDHFKELEEDARRKDRIIEKVNLGES
jgi:hypothetical protein